MSRTSFPFSRVDRRRLSTALYAFTLAELLVVIALLAVLAAIMIPVTSSISEHNKGIECAMRLRQTGLLLQTYTADSNNVLFAYWGGVDGMKDDGVNLWTRKLILRGYLTEDQFLTTLRCPEGKTNYPIHSGTQWFYEAYGINGFDEQIEITGLTRNGNDVRWLTVHLNRIASPGKLILVADSIRRSGGNQSHVLRNGFGLNDPISLRHRKRANAFFLDGHIETLDETGLRALGMTEKHFYLETPAH